MFAGNSLWHLISQTDALSKAILLLLLGMSIVCWAVFFFKMFLFQMKRRDILAVRAAVKRAESLNDLGLVAKKYSNTVPGLFVAQIFELAENPDAQRDSIYYAIDQLVEDLILQEESYLPILSTSAAVAPLLGLFGTVWGLIHAFVGIGESQMVDIATIAPGIAEALTTTLAGLIVAVPALVMVNYLTVQVRDLEQHLVRVGEQIARFVRA